MKIGFHASHEQFKPSKLLELVCLAEKNGFMAAMSSDHFHPWGTNQAESGFAWSWLGSALQTTSLPFGVVNAPGQRYHPAIIAQAAATLAEMYENRFWMAIGTGQLLNEGITGDRWPSKADRNERLKQSAEIIKRLWNGETVTFKGHVKIEGAKLYTLPKKPPLLIGAAISSETAKWMGSWTDGLITSSKPEIELKEVIKSYHRGGGKGNPVYLKVQISYDDNYENALKGAWEQWKTNIFKNTVQTELRLPEQFDDASEIVKPQDIFKKVRISSELEDHNKWLEKDIKQGFEHIYIHNVNRNQRMFIEDFGKDVIPALVQEF